MESGENLYITRLENRAPPVRPEEIPPILARIDGRSGRSGPLRLTVEVCSFEGRPAEFLGGVGEFSVQASVLPTTSARRSRVRLSDRAHRPGRPGNNLTS